MSDITDRNNFQIESLMRIAKETSLIDDCRMTDWVVILTIENVDVIMNHDKAQVFLQGMIRGSLRERKLASERRPRHWSGSSLRAMESHLSLIG